MKERMLDVIKWWLIIAFGASAFYLVYPKYYFGVHPPSGGIHERGNQVTGTVKYEEDGKWRAYGD